MCLSCRTFSADLARSIPRLPRALSETLSELAEGKLKSPLSEDRTGARVGSLDPSSAR